MADVYAVITPRGDAIDEHTNPIIRFFRLSPERNLVKFGKTTLSYHVVRVAENPTKYAFRYSRMTVAENITVTDSEFPMCKSVGEIIGCGGVEICIGPNSINKILIHDPRNGTYMHILFLIEAPKKLIPPKKLRWINSIH